MADSDPQRNHQYESPKSKKPRLEKSLEGDAIFKEFYSDVKLLEDLEIYIKAIQKWNDYSLCMLNISNCNATGPYTFLKAFCQTERYKHEHRIIQNSEIVKKVLFCKYFSSMEKNYWQAMSNLEMSLACLKGKVQDLHLPSYYISCLMN